MVPDRHEHAHTHHMQTDTWIFFSSITFCQWVIKTRLRLGLKDLCNEYAHIYLSFGAGCSHNDFLSTIHISAYFWCQFRCMLLSLVWSEQSELNVSFCPVIAEEGLNLPCWALDEIKFNNEHYRYFQNIINNGFYNVFYYST